MRVIEYATEKEAIEQWNELENKLLHLHDKGTEKYTYLIGCDLVLEPHPLYDKVVNEWIKDKKVINKEYKNDLEI
jgi:catalase (peroxidase I)